MTNSSLVLRGIENSFALLPRSWSHSISSVSIEVWLSAAYLPTVYDENPFGFDNIFLLSEESCESFRGFFDNSIFLAVSKGDANSATIWACIRSNNYGEACVDGGHLSIGIQHQLVVVLTAASVVLYIDGQYIGKSETPIKATYDVLGHNNISSYIFPANCGILGRMKDGYSRFRGNIDDVRIYKNELNSSDIMESFLRGPSVVVEFSLCANETMNVDLPVTTLIEAVSVTLPLNYEDSPSSDQLDSSGSTAEKTDNDLPHNQSLSLFPTHSYSEDTSLENLKAVASIPIVANKLFSIEQESKYIYSYSNMKYNINTFQISDPKVQLQHLIFPNKEFSGDNYAIVNVSYDYVHEKHILLPSNSNTEILRTDYTTELTSKSLFEVNSVLLGFDDIDSTIYALTNTLDAYYAYGDESTIAYCWRGSYGRGIGTIPSTCDSNSYYESLLCYRYCQPGYSDVVSGVDMFCYHDCPSGYSDSGLLCNLNNPTTTGICAQAPYTQYYESLCYHKDVQTALLIKSPSQSCSDSTYSFNYGGI